MPACVRASDSACVHGERVRASEGACVRWGDTILCRWVLRETGQTPGHHFY